MSPTLNLLPDKPTPPSSDQPPPSGRAARSRRRTVEVVVGMDIEPGPGPGDQVVAGSLAMAAPGPLDTARMRAALLAADQLDDPRLMVWAGVIAVSVGDVVTMQRCYCRAVQAARAGGAIGSLPYPLEHVAISEAIGGSYPSARAAAQEGLRLASEPGRTGRPPSCRPSSPSSAGRVATSTSAAATPGRRWTGPAPAVSGYRSPWPAGVWAGSIWRWVDPTRRWSASPPCAAIDPAAATG